MSDANFRAFEMELIKSVKGNYKMVGETIVNKIHQTMLANWPNASNLKKAIKYEVTPEGVNIYSDTPIVMFLDKGTKPHIIRPKNPQGALKFRTEEVITRKNGTKVGVGGFILTKEVKHPGIREKEFVSQALFLVRNDLNVKLFSSTPYNE
jgi:hypothetical protein